MKARVTLLPLAALLVATLPSAGTAQEPAAEPPVWVALGDSYSSGEGIAEAAGECQRASGGGSGSAWAAVAYEELWGAEARAENQALVACTGHKSHQAPSQLDEATARLGGRRPDVISFSFGGNDIGFSPILQECLLDNVTLGVPFTDIDDHGCAITEEEIRDRIDMLAGRRSIGDGYYGRWQLPQLYDEMADAVQPGGHVFVLGYPQMFEEVDRWPWVNRYVWQSCEWIGRKHIEKIRNSGARLNDAVEGAVDDAAARHPDVEFHYLDVADVYENDDSRHGLCTDDPWLNGLQVSQDGSFRVERSYHPNQDGHTATGQALAALIEDDVPELLEGDDDAATAGDLEDALLTPDDLVPGRFAVEGVYDVASQARTYGCVDPRQHTETWDDARWNQLMVQAADTDVTPDGAQFVGNVLVHEDLLVFPGADEAAAYLEEARLGLADCAGQVGETPLAFVHGGWNGYERRANFGLDFVVQRGNVVVELLYSAGAATNRDDLADPEASALARSRQVVRLALDKIDAA
ncbi:MAG TPA: GDSL-type esterase/lipase family protein [Acidimicrobiales bacterium]|nr:GDSL-type esterase/lipase family protein [Acidimicrobiales bacterium]